MVRAAPNRIENSSKAAGKQLRATSRWRHSDSKTPHAAQFSDLCDCTRRPGADLDPGLHSTPHAKQRSRKGHPLHPMLIPFPFAYLFGSAMIDVWGRHGKRRWYRTAHHMNRLGLGSAMRSCAWPRRLHLCGSAEKLRARTRDASHAGQPLSRWAVRCRRGSAQGWSTAAALGDRCRVGWSRPSGCRRVAGRHARVSQSDCRRSSIRRGRKVAGRSACT